MAVSSPKATSEKMEATQKQQQKRTTNPGVRVKGARIYDSTNGKTCHQCRQKTMDFTARCKNMKNKGQCTIMFCHKCLLNRYGENAEEMATRDDWHCPKCRDICNCSCCMKKKGHKPTGIMVHAAKATGFTSVSQLLDVKGPEFSKELAVNGKGDNVSSPLKRGKENTIDGTCNMISNSPNLIPDGKKARKTNQNAPSVKVEAPIVNEAVNTLIKDNVPIVLRRSPRKLVMSLQCNQEKPDRKKSKKTKQDPMEVKAEVASVHEVVGNPAEKDNVANGLRRSPRKFILPHECKQEEPDNVKTSALGSPRKSNIPQVPKKEDKIEVKKEKKINVQAKKKDTSILDYVLDVALPPGTLLTTVVGIDLGPQDAGYALQFMEFCSSFGEVLELRKGQPECVLRDILTGRRRRGKCTSSVQFITQLLSFMEGDSEEPPSSPSNGESTWIHSLKRYLTEAELAPEDIPEDWFDKACDDRYDMLESSQKLRLVTFLCDEALSTPQMRKWIEDQNSKFVEEGKEAKESLNAIKDKEKLIKRKLQEDIAKALIAKNGAPLTISEHESIVSEIKAETKRVQEEISDAMGLVSKKRQRSDAVRTEPVTKDDNGRVFWRLKGLGDTGLLLQDMEAIEKVSPNDKWFSFDDEEMKTVEKYLSTVRLKRHRSNKQADETMKDSRSSPEGDSSSNDDQPAATNCS